MAENDNTPYPVCGLELVLFVQLCFFLSHKHRCSLWLLTAGGVWGNAGGKTASISTRSSICSIEGKTESAHPFKVICIQLKWEIIIEEHN